MDNNYPPSIYLDNQLCCIFSFVQIAQDNLLGLYSYNLLFFFDFHLHKWPRILTKVSMDPRTRICV